MNSIVSNIIKKDYTYVNDIINISVKPLSLIPAGLTYTTLVRLYLNKMNQDNSINFIDLSGTESYISTNSIIPSRSVL